MKRDFPLKGLMRVRELQEEQAASDLARANRAYREAQVARQEAEDMLAQQTFPKEAPAEQVDQQHVHYASPHTPTWRAIVAARASATALLGEYSQAVHAASDVAQAATGQWSEARMRAAMISKLRDKHHRDLAVADLRDEQMLLDESALRRSVEVTP